MAIFPRYLVRGGWEEGAKSNLCQKKDQLTPHSTIADYSFNVFTTTPTTNVSQILMMKERIDIYVKRSVLVHFKPVLLFNPIHVKGLFLIFQERSKHTRNPFISDNLLKNFVLIFVKRVVSFSIIFQLKRVCPPTQTLAFRACSYEVKYRSDCLSLMHCLKVT